MSDEQQIATLSEEIRQAGAGVARRRTRLRRLVWGLLGVDVTTLLASILMNRYGLFPVAGWPAQAVGASFLALAPLSLLALAAFPVPSILRRRSLDRLRRQLAPLPEETLAELLVPLRHDAHGDTRSLASSLAGPLRLRSELTPSGSPGPRGDEPAPAE